MFGFSPVPRMRYPLQPVHRLPRRVPFFLIAHIGANPLQILGTETDNAVAGLPLEHFLSQLLVGLVRRRPFQSADKITDEHRGPNSQAKMHVRFRAANFVNEDTRRVDAAPAQIVMHDGFHLRRQQGRAFFGMPGDVEIDLGVEIAAPLLGSGVRVWQDRRTRGNRRL